LYSKKIPQLLFFLFLCFLGVFSFIANTSSTKDTIVETEQLLPEKLEEVPVNLVVHYPKKATKEVRSKLDALLKRIHKRHDFHGAVLVAKNKKIVYQNQIGTADFKKKTLLNKESVFQLA
jgi:ElaB/YqjD/DUF883 family membrane-anchored ribosome-binding protein